MSIGKELLISDVSHSGWANQQLLDGCAPLSAEELGRDLRISHNSILATLRHIYDGERVWLLCLRTTADLGIWRLPQEPAPELTLDALRQTWPEIWNGFGHWLGDLPENSLTVELMLHLPGEVEQRFPRWKILRHVLEHSTLHRGQVVGMIRWGTNHLPTAQWIIMLRVEATRGLEASSKGSKSRSSGKYGK